MIHTLTLAQAVTLAGVYSTVFFALCKLTSYFDDQYERALLKQKEVRSRLSRLVGALDAKLRAKIQRGSQIGQIIVEGRLPELRDREYAFLPETEFSQVIMEMLPRFAAYARADELTRSLPSGFLWLWRSTLTELAGMFVLAGAVVLEGTTQAQCVMVYRYCAVIQGIILVGGFALYVLLKTRGHNLNATEKSQEPEP